MSIIQIVVNHNGVIRQAFANDGWFVDDDGPSYFDLNYTIGTWLDEWGNSIISKCSKDQERWELQGVDIRVWNADFEQWNRICDMFSMMQDPVLVKVAEQLVDFIQEAFPNE